MKVTVYGTKQCPYCVYLKEWLKDNKVEYEEFLVDENPYAAQTMVQLSGQMGVPFTTIETDEGDMEKILGFDVARLKKILS